MKNYMNHYNQKKFIIFVVVVIFAVTIWLGATGNLNLSTSSNEFSGVIIGVQGRVIAMKGVYTVSSRMSSNSPDSQEITVDIISETNIYKQSRNPRDGKAVKSLVTFDELEADIQQKKFVLAKVHANSNIYLKSHITPDEIIYTTDPYVSI